MGVLFCFVVGLFMALQPISDNDFFWHIVVGNRVWLDKIIPNHELYSWASGKSWVAHEWLTEAIMYKLGPVGCITIMLVIFLGLYILMAKMLRVKFKKIFDFKLLYLLMMCVFFKVTGPRPYIISLVFFAYLIYVLFSYIDKEKKADKLIWTLPVLQILWVNFHGGSSSMIYIFILGTLMCHYFLKLLPWRNERFMQNILDKKQVKTLVIVFFLSILATCINPFGYKMLLYPFSNMTDTSMTSYIMEWNSPSFHGVLGIYIFVMIAIPLFNLILQHKNMKFHEVAFQLLMFYMCLKSQRFIGMYGIYSTWNLGKYFFVTDDMMDVLKKPFIKYQKYIYGVSCGVLVLFAALVGYRQVSSFKNVGLIDNDGFYSDKAVEKLIEIKPERLFNDYSQGGYLLYKLNEYKALDDVKIFAYGLGDVFSNDILPDAMNLSNLYTNPRSIIEKYDFDCFITTKKYPLHYFLDECDDYKLVYEDDMCYIYVRV